MVGLIVVLLDCVDFLLSHCCEDTYNTAAVVTVDKISDLFCLVWVGGLDKREDNLFQQITEN